MLLRRRLQTKSTLQQPQRLDLQKLKAQKRRRPPMNNAAQLQGRRRPQVLQIIRTRIEVRGHARKSRKSGDT